MESRDGKVAEGLIQPRLTHQHENATPNEHDRDSGQQQAYNFGKRF
jgi:hypothetical protein